MLNISRWKIITIIVICILGIAYVMPNMIGPDGRRWAQENLPSWMPRNTINLGLDLQGGSYLLLQVDLAKVMRDHAENTVQAARQELRKARIGYSRIAALPDGVRVSLRDANDGAEVRRILRDVDPQLQVTMGNDNMAVEGRYSESALKELRDKTIGQSIEIVRRRVDETGTNEPDIRRQGDDRIVLQLPGMGDPERIKNLLGRTAQLSFHLVDMGDGRVSGTRTLPMAEIPGETIAIERRAIMTGDMLNNASATFDQNGRPVVSFALNAVGAKRFCDVTRENVNRPFAIVLDNRVLSAPNIREPICGGSAQISGDFTLQEVTDLSLLLRAGALPAPLHVMEERTVGPSLGADSVESGKLACIVAGILVMVMMIAFYGLFGIFASIAMVMNIILLLALMSILGATMTLPGIAGIVLAISMAVDGNVLIYDRIREESRAGRTAMSAVDTGFTKALASIIDANLTSLIAAIILFSLGTGPVKGFAVTMSLGIITSFFTAITVTRLMVVMWLRAAKPKTIPT